MIVVGVQPHEVKAVDCRRNIKYPNITRTAHCHHHHGMAHGMTAR